MIHQKLPESTHVGTEAWAAGRCSQPVQTFTQGVEAKEPRSPLWRGVKLRSRPREGPARGKALLGNRQGAQAGQPASGRTALLQPRPSQPLVSDWQCWLCSSVDSGCLSTLGRCRRWNLN